MALKNTLTLLTPCLNPDINKFRKLLNSIKYQKEIPDEWLIIDGGSSEKNLNIINKYIKSLDSKLSINIINYPGSTIYSALNLGIKKCSSEFYMVIGCDDYLEKESINKFKFNIRENDGIIVSNIIKSDKILKARKHQRKLFPIYGATKLITNHSGGIIIRKELHKKIGLYDESYLILSDAKFIISCYLKKYNFKYLDFISSRIGNDGISSNKKKLVYLELFRLINELEISKLFNLIMLNFRLIKSLF